MRVPPLDEYRLVKRLRASARKSHGRYRSKALARIGTDRDTSADIDHRLREGTRQIDDVVPYDEKDSIAKPRVSAFTQALARASVAPMAATCGWTFGGPAMTSGYWTGT